MDSEETFLQLPDSISDPIQDCLREILPNLVAAGAQSISLTGSWARGNAVPSSDVDLLILGEGSPYRLEHHHQRLVSISWLTFEKAAETLRRPETAPFTVPGWRDAILLYDPSGLGQHLKDEAKAWEWSMIEEGRNLWVAEELTDLAEEIQKLVSATLRKDLRTAAVQRNILALKVPQVLAVYLGILYHSEDHVWTSICEAMGPEYQAAFDRSLGLEVSGKESMLAAAELYRRVTESLSNLLETRQKQVIDAALSWVDRLEAEPGPSPG